MRIWFNHWFSTAYHLIDLMRNGSHEEIVVIGTGSNSTAIYRQNCDEWYSEQEMASDAYVEFCLQFCRDHQVDVFIPRRGMLAIAKANDRFYQIGTKLMLEPDKELVSLLDDKLLTYHFFEARIPEIIPEYRVCYSIADFQDACKTIQSVSGRLCYKLTIDEGARSFRVIDNSIESLKALYEKPGSKITQNAAEKLLSAYDFSVPIVVMPYLSGPDVSVDCMETNTGRLIIPRFKVGRYSEVKNDVEVVNCCNIIMDMMRFEMPANIQFKAEGKKIYLLEINTRMSGGLQLSCKATGINMPAIALNKLVGKTIPWEYPSPWNTHGIMNLETPILVS